MKQDSQKAKEILLIELTVPYESIIEEAHGFKMEKYADLARDLREAGLQTSVFAVEVGAMGFVGSSAYDLMKRLSISGKSRNRALRAMGEAAEKSSCWIWSRRNKAQLQSLPQFHVGLRGRVGKTMVQEYIRPNTSGVRSPFEASGKKK